MIKIIMEIEEESKNKYKDVIATHINVDFKEIHNKPTYGEFESLNIIKDRIGIEEKYQIINNVKKKTKEELFREIYDKLIK